MYVRQNFPLPSITAPNGMVVDPRFVPGPCRLTRRTQIFRATPAGKRFAPGSSRLVKQNSPRGQLLPAPRLGSFWDTLLGGSAKAGNFALNLNPITSAITQTASGIIGAVKGSGNKNQQQPAQQQTSSLGPLATVSTGTILGVSLGAAALVLAIAKGGR